MNKALPLVTFDLGGVIVRISTSLEEAAFRAGVKLRDAKPDQTRWSSLFVQWQSGQVTDEAFFEQWAACVGRFDAHDAPKLSLGWLQHEFEGIQALLGSLHGLGVPMGCLSNTSRHHWDYMLAETDRYPSLRWLQHLHASHLIGVMKPDEAIYRAYERLTGYRPEDIVFFDDLQANVDGAKRCGWQAVRIDPKADPAAQVRARLREIGVLPG
ncbi:MAG: HAD-IA family hydrolase [Deltaproteobacteria bacterium]|nr:HAD-IA family hydrolase [Deltaproteobacteria bacterium]